MYVMQQPTAVCCSPLMSSSARNRKGYHTDIFPGIEVPAKFLCVLCKLVLRNPVQRFCGHRYCKNCVDEASAGSDFVCPACVADDNQDEVPDSSEHQASLVLHFPRMSCGIDITPYKPSCIVLALLAKIFN